MITKNDNNFTNSNSDHCNKKINKQPPVTAQLTIKGS